MPCPSADHLAEILERLYAMPELRKEIGERCYERVTDSQFSWETVASQFGGIFEDVLLQEQETVSSETPEPKKPSKKRGKRVLTGSAT
jgi:hypothetical protein